MSKITETVVRKVLSTVDAGLCSGVGVPKPGQMCVMAAINYALGHEHGDEPDCVHAAVRRFDIRLNDSKWSSNAARAKGMRREAIAKLGSTGINGQKFAELVSIGTVARVLPKMLGYVAKRFPDMAEDFTKASEACASVTTRGAAESAARNAAVVCRKARSAADADAYAADAYAAAAYAADAYAADADAAAYATDAAYAAYAADADAYAAYAAAEAAAYAAAYARDEILTESANVACDALVACGSEGTKFLYLCHEEVE